MTSTTRALQEIRHSGRIAKSRRNQAEGLRRERIPAAALGRPATAR